MNFSPERLRQLKNLLTEEEFRKLISGNAPPDDGSPLRNNISSDARKNILTLHTTIPDFGPPESAADVDYYFSQIIACVGIINKVLAPYKTKISCERFYQHLTASTTTKEAMSKHFVRDPDGNVLGVMHEATILTYAATLLKILKDIPLDASGEVWASRFKKAFRILIRGSCQAGKACATCALYYMTPALVYILSKRKVKLATILNLVQSNSLHSQTRKELRGFRALYSDLIISSETDAISVGEYLGMQKREGNFLSAEEQEEQCVVIRTARGIKVVRKTLQTLIDKGYTPVIFTDECHFGSEKNGGQDRLIRCPEIEDIPNDVCQIAISATPDEVLSDNVIESQGWDTVDLVLDYGYIGPGFCNGHRLTATPRYTEQLPVNQDINTWMRENKIDINISRKAYRTKEGYCQVMMGIPSKRKAQEYYEQNRTEVDAAYQAYREKFDKSLLQMLRILLKRSQTITIRAFLSNSDTRTLMAALELLKEPSDDFTLAPFFLEEKKVIKPNVKEYIARYQGKAVILFVTADARMGAAFPSSNNVFVDLTEAKPYTNTLIQGLYGRACGYNKIYKGNLPLVLLSERSNQLIELLKKNRWKWKYGSKAPGPRTQKIARVQMLRPEQRNILVALDPTRPEIRDPEACRRLSNIINMIWVGSGRPHRADSGGSGREKTLKWCTHNKKLVFTDEFLSSTIYKIRPDLKLLRFCKLGEIDRHTGFIYDVRSEKYPGIKGVVGIRTSRGFATMSRNTRRDDNQVVEPQISIELKMGVVCPKCQEPCIATKLYRLKDEALEKFAKEGKMRSDGGHWPKEALESCCWENSEAIGTSVLLRIAEITPDTEEDEPSEFEARKSSRYLDEEEEDEVVV